MNATMELTLHNRISELERVSQAVESFAEAHQVPATVLHAINLCLDEVVTNIISYAYDDQTDHQITVRLALRAGELTIEVEDDGKPFNPLTAPEPDLYKPMEERQIGGLGIHLLRNVMDDIEYRRQQDHNLLIMRKTVEM
jgi:anti-sigma regulatory factor (Ser/Thr protein kinase)